MNAYIHWAASPPDDTIAITHPTRAALLADIGGCMADRRGYTLATLNLDHCVKIRDDPAFRAAYLRHSHVVADGNPVVWLSRLAGHRVELVPGSELIVPLVALAARHAVPIALVGSTQDTLAATAAALRADHPDLHIVAQIAPVFGFDTTGPDADAVVAALADSGARLCFLALGAPK